MVSGWAEIGRVAAAQDGVFSVDQAAGCGIDRRRLNRAEASGLVDRIHPNVWRFVGTPLDDRGRARAATVQAGPDSASSHESSLWLHRVERIPFVPVVIVPADASTYRFDGIRVHRMGDLRPEHRCVVDGIPTTTLERAIVDATSVLLPARLGHLIDEVTITHRRTSVGAIGRTLRQVNRRGRLRIARLGELLDERRPAEPAPRSRLERRVDELLRSTSLPRPLREHPLPNEGNLSGLVDRLWPAAMLILEIDGRSWHAREKAMAVDRARDRTAARLGWQTLRVLDEEVAACGPAAVDDIETAYATRLDQLRRTG
jgi:Transcriptional regulator, AbiEi antitoxin